MKYIAIIFLFLFSLVNVNSQQKDSLDNRVYKVKALIDIPITTVTLATNLYGFKVTDQKPRLDSATIFSLDPNDINRFDRSATQQNVDFAPTARKLSDIGMYVSYGLPFILLADQEIRKDWAPLLLLYLETEAIVGNLFSWGAAVHIDRIRPLVYNPDVPYEEKIFKRNKNSFYSGHTSTSAASSFFVAKVYCDYHPELGRRKFLIYSIAIIPPAFTGFMRYKGMKHFPTDVMTGIAVGAVTGILVPHLHKNKNKNFAMVPFSGQYTGLAISMKF